jgi:hypothetical protein
MAMRTASRPEVVSTLSTLGTVFVRHILSLQFNEKDARSSWAVKFGSGRKVVGDRLECSDGGGAGPVPETVCLRSCSSLSLPSSSSTLTL